MACRSRTWRPEQWGERTERPRVLIETPDPAVLTCAQQVLRDAGYDVAGCGGPETMDGRRCPLVAGGECALAAGADVIYTALHWRDRDSQKVLEALRERYPQTPIVVEIAGPDVERFRDLIESCRVVTLPVGRKAMLTAVANALDHAVTPTPVAIPAGSRAR